VLLHAGEDVRALAMAHEYDEVLELVRERAALRRELEVLDAPPP
jgi:hypothetical protein